MRRSHKGKFRPLNPEKYKGNVTEICWRSSWELKLMMELDKNPDVLEWNSEEIAIHYISPIDKKPHRYFPDFWVKKVNRSDGKIVEVLIEVKPKKETAPPQAKTGKPTKKYINEVYTWGVNSAKWEAAEKFCKQKGWQWMIMTEHELGIKR